MMVYPHDESRLVVALQTDHSRLAGQLAAHWGNQVFAEPRPWVPVVVAAQEHDNGWWNWEIMPALDGAGQPADYAGYYSPEWVALYKAGIQRVIDRDPYAGLLVLMHGLGLTAQAFGLRPTMTDMRHDPMIQQFHAEYEPIKTGLLERLQRSADYRDVSSDDQIWTNFKLLEVCDQFAQFICNHYPLTNNRRRSGPGPVIHHVPVRAGHEDVSLTIEVLDDEHATVRPYPFKVDPFEISFPLRLLPMQRYESQEELLRQFYRAERKTATYRLSASSFADAEVTRE